MRSPSKIRLKHFPSVESLENGQARVQRAASDHLLVWHFSSTNPAPARLEHLHERGAGRTACKVGEQFSPR